MKRKLSVIGALIAAAAMGVAQAQTLEVSGATTVQKRILEPGAAGLKSATGVELKIYGPGTGKGMLALIENPEQMERLRSDSSLADTAVEEILRWSSPVVHFVRTAVQETEIRGQRIRAGESVAMFYPSASRDETVFEDPEDLDLARSPNPHVSFGIGEHYCLGASLAKLELECIFRELAARIEHVELAGPVERLRATVIGGVKRMPVRISLA